MSLDISQFYQVFFDEAEEHLATMESLLLALNVGAPDKDNLNAIFRAAHSVKGGGGIFGFEDITRLTHLLETLLDRLRREEARLTTGMVDVFLSAVDVLKELLRLRREDQQIDPAILDEACAALARVAEDPPPPVATPAPSESGHRYRYRIEARVEDPESLDGLLEDLARDGIVGERRDFPGRLSFRLATDRGVDDVRDCFAFFIEPEDVAIVEEGEGGIPRAELLPPLPAPPPPRAEPESIARPAQPARPNHGTVPPPSEIAARRPSPVSESREPPRQNHALTVAAPAPSPIAPPPAAPAMPSATPVAAAPAPAGDKPASSGETSIRVGVDKVDQLVNLVGELVITQAMLAQTAGELPAAGRESLLGGLALLERHTRDLQEAVMSIRMLPVSGVFSRFPRLVRDLSARLNKTVNFRMEGEATELDKGLIEKIIDPLTHLLRNSLDHGLEAPEVRLAKGKPAAGSLTLRAYHQSGNVVIEVRDDGAGLDRRKILDAARQKGLAAHDGMSDQEVWQLLFMPGFSTASRITDLSGRGVGLDVVKKNIESLGGRVDIDSTPGLGTAVLIRLPLTLAILDGLSVRIGEEIYILPLTCIVESLQPGPDTLRTMGGRDRVCHVRGEYLPLADTGETLRLPASPRADQDRILVIFEADGAKAAMLVDELLGQHQVVIKSLESNYRKVPCVAGATILGDGRVALILDALGLARQGRQREPASANPPARALAPARPDPASHGGPEFKAAPGEYLVFTLGEEEYGIDILAAQEIRRYDTVTPILGAPDFVKGVINLRGAIVPIIDLRVRFHLNDVTYTSFTVVIVLNVGGRVVGIVVDSVSDVTPLAAEQLRPPPVFDTARDNRDYLIGLGVAEERMIILMDIARLLNHPSLGLVAD